jgi:hypothetical protein
MIYKIGPGQPARCLPERPRGTGRPLRCAQCHVFDEMLRVHTGVGGGTSELRFLFGCQIDVRGVQE